MTDSKPYLFRCPDCRAKNRIPADKTNAAAKCGKCGIAFNTRELFLPQPVTVTDGNFETMVLKSPLPVLLDCWAAWCGPCAMVGPVIEELAGDWKGKIRVGKLDVETNPVISGRFDLRSIPTLLVFDGGRLRDTLVGALPKSQIVQKMAPFL